MKSKSAVLLKAAQSRTTSVKQRIEAAKRMIEQEIEAANGIYPLNGGRLSLAEVCRRAGVHEITIMGATHKSTTKKALATWLSDLKARMVSGTRRVRKTVTDRADKWQEQYELIAAQFKQFHSLEIPRRDQEIVDLKAKVVALEALVAELHAVSSTQRVVAFPRKKG